MAINKNIEMIQLTIEVVHAKFNHICCIKYIERKFKLKKLIFFTYSLKKRLCSTKCTKALKNHNFTLCISFR
jgi:hypothetical protein